MSQVQDVKQATDILEVIGQRLQLQRAGSSYKAVCPFHSEKTPSFFINQDTQRYKCFGCGQSGDVLAFLQEYEGMSFVEALEQLADQAGITLERYRPSSQEQRGKTLLEILDLAKEYYHYLLTEHKQGQSARRYLKQRGVTAESIKVFQLGYAPGRWDGVLTYLTKKKGYQLEQLVEAGLVINRSGRRYDRFRDRVMFPLKNHRGQVVGFSGRLLDDDAQEAKYINSPETSLYHKSKLLYGYHELRQEIRKAGQVVVTEGEMDVISSSQAHLNNVVAIKGSALSSDQVRLLKRLVEKVILALDTDAAGVTATKRAIPVVEQAELELRVAKLPAGKDPDDLARNDPKLLRQSISRSVSVYEFIIEAALAAHDAAAPEGKRHVMLEVAPYLSQLGHAVERDYYIKLLADRLHVKPSLVQEDVASAGARAQTGFSLGRTPPPHPGTASRPGAAGQADVSGTTDSPGRTGETVVTRRHRLEKYLVYVWMQLLEAQHQLTTRESGGKAWQSLEWHQPELQQLLEQLSQGDTPSLTLRQRLAAIADDLQELASEIWLDPELAQTKGDADLEKEWFRALIELQILSIQEQKRRISSQLDELAQADQLDEEQVTLEQELLATSVTLDKELKNLMDKRSSRTM